MSDKITYNNLFNISKKECFYSITISHGLHIVCKKIIHGGRNMGNGEPQFQPIDPPFEWGKEGPGGCNNCVEVGAIYAAFAIIPI